VLNVLHVATEEDTLVFITGKFVAYKLKGMMCVVIARVFQIQQLPY
jgi:hypothetical protein